MVNSCLLRALHGFCTLHFRERERERERENERERERGERERRERERMREGEREREREDLGVGDGKVLQVAGRKNQLRRRLLPRQFARPVWGLV